MDKFSIYHDLLIKWQKTVNLVSNASLLDLWRRHFLDSAQLMPHIPTGSAIMDVGSGAGFPGMVLAILGIGEVFMVESDRKKCEFLKNVSRETKTPVHIYNERIENISQKTDVITSRALAPLPQLLPLCIPLMGKNAFCLFHKGKNYSKEIEDAQISNCFTWNILNSITDPHAVIVKLSHIEAKNG